MPLCCRWGRSRPSPRRFVIRTLPVVPSASVRLKHSLETDPAGGQLDCNLARLAASPRCGKTIARHRRRRRQRPLDRHESPTASARPVTVRRPATGHLRPRQHHTVLERLHRTDRGRPTSACNRADLSTQPHAQRHETPPSRTRARKLVISVTPTRTTKHTTRRSLRLTRDRVQMARTAPSASRPPVGGLNPDISGALPGSAVTA
jgi:hypothetical protein